MFRYETDKSAEYVPTVHHPNINFKDNIQLPARDAGVMPSQTAAKP